MPRELQTTSPRGLDRAGLPLRLFEKAKRHGIWNPSDLALAADRPHWLALEDAERDLLLRLVSLFQAGEESVALDLLPLVSAIAAEGRLEEEMFLTAFLWEEAKHVDFFRRFLDEVAEETGDLSRYHGASYRALLYDELPAAMHRLSTDRSPVAIAEAAVTYNMIVEGVLAETGYHAFHATLDRRGILPATCAGVAHLARDEARHIAYGVHLICRLSRDHGEPVRAAIAGRMEALLPLALGLIEETFAAYDEVPFGLSIDDFTGFALQQFQYRWARIEAAREGEIFEPEGL